MARLLVTGGAGYVGSHAVHGLAAAGYDVVVFDDLSAGHAEAVDRLAQLFPQRRITLIRGDILDSGAVRGALRDSGAGAVMHFAARLLVAESVREPIGYYRANVTGTMTVLEPIAEMLPDTGTMTERERHVAGWLLTVRADRTRDAVDEFEPSEGPLAIDDRGLVTEEPARPIEGRIDRQHGRPIRPVPPECPALGRSGRGSAGRDAYSSPFGRAARRTARAAGLLL